MKRRLAIAITSLALLAPIAASPAYASTDSGSLSCTRGSTIAVRGEQQRLDILTLKANGSTLGTTNSAYILKKTSSATSGTWSASSSSLLFSGTYGWCNPNSSL